MLSRSHYGALAPALEHFQEKWNPVFRLKMRHCKKALRSM